MVKMKATKAHRYAGKRLAAGDPFEATPKHARLLAAANRAVLLTSAQTIPVHPTPTLAAIATKAAAIQQPAPAVAPTVEQPAAVAKSVQQATTITAKAAADTQAAVNPIQLKPQSKDLTAEKEKDEEAKKRAQYKRRDLTAE